MLPPRPLLAGLALALSSTAALADARSLDIVAPWEITGADPSTSGYVFGRMRVAETLVDTDASGRPAPGLATRWHQADDGLRWRFTLRDDARFHDGSPVTAEAVVTSLEHALAKPGILDSAPITAIEADGDEVVISLAQAFAPLPALLAHSTTLILAPAAYGDDGQVTEMIASGPYRVESLAPPQRLTVSRFDDYWGETPEIEQASYLAVGRGETRALMAESGDADIVFTLDPASRARLSRHDRLDLHAEPLPRTIVLKTNAGHPFLDDDRARRALGLAIDRPGIASGLLRHPEAAAAELFPESLGPWHLGLEADATRDLDQARALLAELGWEANGNGILERDGEPFRLTLRTFSDRPELPLVATALQDQWRELGVELEVAVGNASEIPSGHRDGSLELGLMARNYGLVPDPLGTLLDDFGSDPDAMGGDWGAMGWSDAELADWLDTLRHEADPDARAELATRVARRLHEAMPVIPVAWYQQTAAVNGALEGFSIDALERSYRIDELRWSE
ncbi:ABC transporter substrate-binding protein [Halomonas heilongjiangensis]|uniref:ABC transporter substrate-binding protein n=1 Tax=Halomonas heilongjiangensis TaxID=1387883 RepID=A0A2N7TP09_9GAMM|nr:ABC transporter substrate-binding protein [Halomonas heilongjiangensis]PMR69934.1 ABC transporter substrate-binding protein [Halomonas heilongjiangensis]PXX94093.1 ABC transporter substrate-binding protein [Halomonas heilongjiangensis]